MNQTGIQFRGSWAKPTETIQHSIQNFEGNSCAILATLSANVAILEQMKRLSIDFNAGDLKSGRTPLHHAVENNDAGEWDEGNNDAGKKKEDAVENDAG